MVRRRCLHGRLLRGVQVADGDADHALSSVGLHPHASPADRSRCCDRSWCRGLGYPSHLVFGRTPTLSPGTRQSGRRGLLGRRHVVDAPDAARGVCCCHADVRPALGLADPRRRCVVTGGSRRADDRVALPSGPARPGLRVPPVRDLSSRVPGNAHDSLRLAARAAGCTSCRGSYRERGSPGGRRHCCRHRRSWAGAGAARLGGLRSHTQSVFLDALGDAPAAGSRCAAAGRHASSRVHRIAPRPRLRR